MLITKPDEFTRCCLGPSNTVKALTLLCVAGWDIIRRSVIQCTSHRLCEYEVTDCRHYIGIYVYFPNFLSTLTDLEEHAHSLVIVVIVIFSKPNDFIPRDNQIYKSSILVLRIRTCAQLVILATSNCTYRFINYKTSGIKNENTGE